MNFGKSIRLGLAALLSAWVLLLSAATVSPDLHNRLHHHVTDTCDGHCHEEHSDTGAENPSDPEHVCAVTLFAGGVDCDLPVSLSEATFLPVGNIDDPDVDMSPVVQRALLRARAPPVVAI